MSRDAIRTCGSLRDTQTHTRTHTHVTHHHHLHRQRQFLLFSFSVFRFLVFGSERYIKLTYRTSAFERALKEHLVSYRIVSVQWWIGSIKFVRFTLLFKTVIHLLSRQTTFCFLSHYINYVARVFNAQFAENHRLSDTSRSRRLFDKLYGRVYGKFSSF